MVLCPRIDGNGDKKAEVTPESNSPWIDESVVAVILVPSKQSHFEYLVNSDLEISVIKLDT